MMHFCGYRRLSSIAWTILIVALVACYVTIVAGLIGVVSAAAVSLVSFGGAMVGCIAAMIYLIAATHDLRGAHGA
jgi:hypothetical protein